MENDKKFTEIANTITNKKQIERHEKIIWIILYIQGALFLATIVNYIMIVSLLGL